MTQVLVIMGVSGSGKTTVGRALAERLGCPFYDGDDFHPPHNVARMRAGVPLTDDDRAPWLSRLSHLIEDHSSRNETAVIACSALKRSYRDQLRGQNKVQFIFLDGEFELIWERMQRRENHYMQAAMLYSQYETLEKPDPEEAIWVPVDKEIDEILAAIQLAVKKRECSDA